MRPSAPVDADRDADVSVGVIIGVVGGRWRGRVTPWGAIVPADDSPTLDWWVAADDRWHTPVREPSLRQRTISGTPVVETAVRIPGGDVVQTVYAVGTGGGLTVIELENRSPAPVAVAFSRRDLATTRPPAAVPVQGGEAPSDALVVPVGHRSSVRVAIAHDGLGARRLPDDLPSPDAVVRGWLAQTARGAELRLPAVPPVVDLTAVRCTLLLEGPPARGATVEQLVGVAELGRLGVAVEPWIGDVVAAAEAVGRRSRRAAGLDWVADAGLVAALEVLERAGHRRGASDVAAMRDRLPPAEPTPVDPPEGVLGLAWAARRVAVARPGGVDLVPAPYPPAWLGHPVETYGLPVGGGITVSVAVRWHGDRPALLWEVDGAAASLTCSGLDPAWRTSAPRGDGLLTPRPA